MSEIRIERRRSGRDLLLGALAVLMGPVVLGTVVLAPLVSVVFIGSFAAIAGVIALHVTRSPWAHRVADARSAG
jgi:uncharacterized membrane protein HdeD (DUF308 family)